MTTKTEDRLLGLAVAALLTTLGGELLAIPLLVAVGLVGFFTALPLLFAVMTVTLAVSLKRSSGPEMRDPAIVDRTR
ncbi:MAG: hypothetical protein ACOC06_08255 [Halorubrum sp.]